MQVEPLTLSWTELNHSAARQYIDSRAVYSAWIEARGHLRAAEFATSNIGCQASAEGGLSHYVLGRDKQATNLGDDSIHKSLTVLKHIAFERLCGLERSLKIHQRRNRREQVGMAPPVITRVLRAVQEVCEGTPAYLSGSHALLGYAAAAGVHLSWLQPFSAEQSPWLDFDLDLVLRYQLSHEDIESMLLRADPTFRYDAKGSVATNSTSLTVTIAQAVKAEPISYPPRPINLTGTISSTVQEGAVHKVHLASEDGNMAEVCVPDVEQLTNFLLNRSEVCKDSFETQRLISLAYAVQALAKRYLQNWPEHTSIAPLQRQPPPFSDTTAQGAMHNGAPRG